MLHYSRVESSRLLLHEKKKSWNYSRNTQQEHWFRFSLLFHPRLLLFSSPRVFATRKPLKSAKSGAEEQTTWIIYRMMIIIKTFHISTSKRASSRGGREQKEENINRHEWGCEVFMPNERIAESIVVVAAQAFKSFFFRSSSSSSSSW